VSRHLRGVDDSTVLGAPREEETLTIARNLSTRYIAIGTEMVIGLLVLPFNVAHLGPSAYGLWMLASGVTMYFSVLDLGYQNALIKYVAQYRAERNARALNEILSSTFFVFALLAVVAYVAALITAAYLDRLFHITPEQLQLGRTVFLIVSMQFAAGLVFGVFGGVINGFQRYDLNNLVSAVCAVVTAIVNVAVLLAGYGLVELVAATTTARLLFYFVYRANAYRVFPGLSIRPSLFRLERLREITPFSMHMLVIDWAYKINYSVDVLVIGAFLNTTAVAIWSVAQRLADAAQRLSNQLNDVLFPAVVDNDTAGQQDRLQSILLVGTRFSLAIAVPICGALYLNAGQLIHAWVGADFARSAMVLKVLTLIVIVRVGAATANTVLKGTGKHRLVAINSVGTAVVNVVLSLALVQPMGLLGVAIGTIVPVSFAGIVVLFPAGCRRVDVPLARAWRVAIWPAMWPAIVMAAFSLLTQRFVPLSLPFIAAHMVATILVYVVVFSLFAVSADERRFFLSRAKDLIAKSARRRPPVPVASEGA
jgi:O-antigen/teichoic acid export membrane protein